MTTGKARLLALVLPTALAAGLIVASAAYTAGGAGGQTAKNADKLFEDKNYKDAAEAYQAILKASGGTKDTDWHHAHRRLVMCDLRLQLFDEAVAAAEAYVKGCKDTPYEARAERLTGNLWMLIPHWGTRAGGTFHRGQWKQGIQLQSHQHDKKRAAAHLQRARELYAHYDSDAGAKGLDALPEAERKGWHDERIDCTFDLAGVCSRYGIYENAWHFWYRYWGERDEFLAETAGERDFDEYDSIWQRERKRPIGLRIGADGKPLFPTAPKEYSDDLNDDQKLLFLLREARQLDKTENHRHTAQSYYRQAMLARARFGMDRLNSYAGIYWWGGKYPLKEELEKFNPWEAKDSEALVLAGGQVRKVTLPDELDVLKLLRLVVSDYAASGIADEAQYAVGLYYQSRQQYTTALGEYEALRRKFPQGKDAIARAEGQAQKIKAPQVAISQMGVQLPGRPAQLQLSYRNVSKVWFIARKIDAEGFLKELRDQPIDPDKGLPGLWSLGNWSYYFTSGFHRDDIGWKTAVKHVGAEVARWSDQVKDDGTHRYAHVMIQTALKDRGAYLVYCYTGEPPADDAAKKGQDALNLGASRAVLALQDLAIVDKKTREGNLYFICDAQTGSPVSQAKVDVLHVWTEWDQAKRKTNYFKEMHNLTTDKEGMAVLKDPKTHYGNLHVLVKGQAERLAWSGMSYWSAYHPSRMQDGLLAYIITDRPVYRPEQTVRLKVWLRRMRNGILTNVAGEQVSLTIYDPRGNGVHSLSKNADQYGGIDGEYKLPGEPPLGIYRIQVDGRAYAGGENFRVEEYKKPEFEVAVTPGKTHTRLGEKLTAEIKATYYFGGPLTDATVNYKVFRQEYTHGYCFPGEWDWLYGPGYGWCWYEFPWFEWWSRHRCCWAPPWWWYGWYGGSAPSPVRELVQQGSTRIGPDGKLAVEIDTAAALRDHGDRDHQYIVEAEVRDASRRVITGQGAVKVTRQAYYAFVQPDGGYYRPGEEMLIRIRCLTPDNEPVQAEGQATVSSVVFGGPENARIEEKQVQQWKVATDGKGSAEFRLRYEKSGQLKIRFAAPDRWGGVVEGFGLVWVCGRDFEGQLYRFNDLELITDKRTYKPGETAHVMINTQHAGSHVLFSDEVDSSHLLSWRLLRLAAKTTVVDIPIKENSRPNFFIEATTVAATRVHQQALQICVPPAEGILNVSVAADKAQYKPGEKAAVKVIARTPDGKPAQAQVALAAIDKSVLYIQDEYTPPIAKFFHGNLRHHQVMMSTNLYDLLSAYGYVVRPFQDLYPYAQSWWGVWGPEVQDWRAVTDEELEGMAGDRYGGGVGGKRKQMAEPESIAREGLSHAADAVAARPATGAPAGAPAMKSARRLDGDLANGRLANKPGAGGELVEPEVRAKFADTAVWLTTLTTDSDGIASATFEMPENLTTWKINAWGLTRETRVGQATTSAVTTKNLLVRLQAPRFFLESDEVIISANVHNYLKAAKKAQVVLELDGECVQPLDEQGKPFGRPAADDPKKPATFRVTRAVDVAADGEKRVDWRVRVRQEGAVKVRVKALTDEESDAMEMAFPVLVHGITKQVASTGSIRPDDVKKTLTVELSVPDQRRPELTYLEVKYSPSLIGAMMDALPYCIYYPYGCTEQTMSRFLPCVMTLKTLQNMGIRLEDVRKIRGRMEEIRRIEKGERLSIYWMSPIFDQAELDKMVRDGLSRIGNMQQAGGGWGWWQHDDASPYLTAYVLYALCAAQQCDVKVDDGMIQRGMNWLRNWEIERMKDAPWAPDAQHAFSAYVLSLKKLKAEYKPEGDDKRPGDLIERLWQGRDRLCLYAKAILSLALAELGQEDRARTVLANILQFKQENPETQVAWFRTPEEGWWYWWNSDIESNATALRALVRLDPKSDLAPRLVKWLLNNRRNGYYWRSTRDTTMCVAAMSDFVTASGEGKPDFTLTLDFDNGAVVKKVRIDKDNFFTYDNAFIMQGEALGGGKHTLKITKDGPGALYFNTYLRYFTKEPKITAAGHELKVDRQYFKLVQIPYEVEVEGAAGQKLKERRLRYQRIAVKDGDQVKSGDVIQVELKVASDNDYQYLCFEDAKPAGCEPTEVRSGGKGQEGFWSYMELRDAKTVFFLGSLGQGEHLLRYRLRAEIPGVFHALPAILYGMYTPELRANSDEQVIKIAD